MLRPHRSISIRLARQNRQLVAESGLSQTGSHLELCLAKSVSICMGRHMPVEVVRLDVECKHFAHADRVTAEIFKSVSMGRLGYG